MVLIAVRRDRRAQTQASNVCGHQRTPTNRHERQRTAMAVRCLPLPDELRITHGELEAKTPEQQHAFYRALLDHWQANYHRQFQLDLEADQRAFVRGYIDEPGPINDFYRLQSSTNRTAKP